MRERIGAIAPYLAVFGLILAVGSFLIPPVDGMTWLPTALQAAGGAMILAWPFLQPDVFRDMLGARQARFGGNAVLLTIAVLGVVGVINYLGTLRYARLDVTEGQRFSISNQTRQILDDLSDRGDDIRLTAIVTNGSSEATDLVPLVEQYTGEAGNISFDMVDPDLDRLQLLAIQQRTGDPPPRRGLLAEMNPPAINPETGEPEASQDYRNEVVYSFDEQAITEALVKLTRTEPSVVGFVIGHGEMGTDPDSEGRSLSAVAQQLERLSYQIEPVNLSTVTETLDADVLVVAGAQRSYTDAELQALQTYVEGGGAVLLLLDGQGEARFDALLAPSGVRVRDDDVLDPLRSYQGVANLPVIAEDGYLFHEITRDLEQEGLNLIFFNAASLDVGDSLLESVSATPLLQTSEEAWGETGLATLAPDAQPSKDPDEAVGPLSLAVAIEGADAVEGEGGGASSYGRIVVISGAEMASDAFIERFQWPYNPLLVLNSINWLTQDEALIGIPAVAQDERPLEAPQNPWLLILSTALLMPAVVAGLGFYVFWSRR